MQLLCLGDIAFIKENSVEWDWVPTSSLYPNDEGRILFNWELPIGEKLNPVPRECGGPRLLSSPGSPRILSKWAPGIAALATNHILDAGEEGLSNTISDLQKSGFHTLGAGKNQDEIMQPFIWETSDGSLAILNWVFVETDPDLNSIPGPNYWPGIDKAKEIINELKQKVDWVVVFAHWSDENFSYPRPDDRVTAKLLAESGIDCFIGHHPHVVRGMEYIGDCIVFYSLGNFYFSEVINDPDTGTLKWAPRNRESLGVGLSFRKGSKPDYRILSFWQESNKVSVDPQNRAARRMKQMSKPFYHQSWEKYGEWYLNERQNFDRLWGRWHFGFKKYGLIGYGQYVVGKLKARF